MTARAGLTLCATALAALATSGCAPEAAPLPERRSLVFGILPVQAPVLSPTLAKAFSTALPGVSVRFVEPASGVDFVSALQKGELDVTILFADTAYLAFVGQLGGEPYDRLRGIATLNPNPLYLVVQRGSRIRRLEDLRGRRVGVGRREAPTALTAAAVLGAFDLQVKASNAGVTEAVTELLAGRLDAVFVGGVSAAEQVRAALAGGAEVLPFAPETIARLQRRHPFLHGMVIPKDLAGGASALTIGLDGLLVCRSELDADIVYGVTKAFFQALPDLSAFDTPPLHQMNPEDASATPIPLHEGAARYYREQGTM
jgi:TRAP transporter TAXI family solute receptor